MADRLDNYKQLLKSGLITREEFEYYKARYESGAFRSKMTDETRFQYARERQKAAAEAVGMETDDVSGNTFESESEDGRGTSYDDDFCREENGEGGFHIPHTVNIPKFSGSSMSDGEGWMKIVALVLIVFFWPAGLVFTMARKPFGEKGQKLALILTAVMAFITLGNVMSSMTHNYHGGYVDRFVEAFREEIAELDDFDDGEDVIPGDDNGGTGDPGDVPERWFDAENDVYYYGTPDVDISTLDEDVQEAFDEADWVLSNYPYSESELRGYLEEFDHSSRNVDFVLQHCGADWYQEAIWQAEKGYGDQAGVDEQYVRYYLELFGYTPDQIDYAVKYAAIDWKA